MEVSEAALENISRSTSSTYADIRISLVSCLLSLSLSLSFLFLLAPRFFLLSPASSLVYPSLRFALFDSLPPPRGRAQRRVTFVLDL